MDDVPRLLSWRLSKGSAEAILRTFLNRIESAEMADKPETIAIAKALIASIDEVLLRNKEALEKVRHDAKAYDLIRRRQELLAVRQELQVAAIAVAKRRGDPVPDEPDDHRHGRPGRRTGRRSA